jgi:hypothetical protein
MPYGKTTIVKAFIICACLELFCVSFFPSCCLAQENQQKAGVMEWRKWQVSLNVGAQMSGYKPEDFVKSNYSPLLNVSAGRWIIPSVAVMLGYKGWYFSSIADNDKHGYGFYYVDAVINVPELFNEKDSWSKWYLNLHGGGGFFYNYYYMKPNICANAGLSFNYRIGSRFLVGFDAASIIGWDIYQGNTDILPGITLGFSYLF